MPEGVVSLAILTVFPAAMVLAGASDLFTMRISNRLTGGLALAFFAMAALAGMDLATLAWHLSAGAAMLALSLALFAPGWVGGGDAKLLSATALWLGWGPLLYYGLLAALAGGVFTFLLLRFRSMPLPAWAGGQPWLTRLHRADQRVPYCITLAAAGLAAYSQSYWLTDALV